MYSSTVKRELAICEVKYKTRLTTEWLCDCKIRGVRRCSIKWFISVVCNCLQPQLFTGMTVTLLIISGENLAQTEKRKKILKYILKKQTSACDIRAEEWVNLLIYTVLKLFYRFFHFDFPSFQSNFAFKSELAFLSRQDEDCATTFRIRQLSRHAMLTEKQFLNQPSNTFFS